MFGSGPPENEEVERHESRPLEAQGLGTVGDGESEVGTRPVEDGHKIVGYGTDATGGEVADRLLVIVDVALELARPGFDMLVDRHTFDDGPGEPGIGDELLPPADFVDGPHLAVGDVVQRMDDVGGACLPDILQRYGVIGPVPAPGLSAKDRHGMIIR